METERDIRWRDAGFLVAVFLGVVGLLVVFHIPWPRSLAEWAGDKPPVEVLALIITPLGALGALTGVFVSARSNARTLRHAVAGGRASRFQKGAEMLAAPATSSALGGMNLLSGVAQEDEDVYLVPVLQCLIGFIYDQDLAVKDAMAFHIRPFVPYEDVWPISNKLTMDAIGMIGTLLPDQLRWPTDGKITHENRLMIQYPYLAGAEFQDDTLPHVHIRRAVINYCQFRRVNFEDTVLQATIGNNVVLENCNLRNARLFVRAPDTKPLPHRHGNLQIIGGVLEGLMVNGLTFDSWLAGDEPPIGWDERPQN